MGIIKQSEKGLLIVVSGPSGAGKDTVINKVLETEKNVWVSISMTSRPPRGNEENGKDYFFVTKEEFEENIKQGNLLEYATYNDNYYGTSKKVSISPGRELHLCGQPDGRRSEVCLSALSSAPCAVQLQTRYECAR